MPGPCFHRLPQRALRPPWGTASLTDPVLVTPLSNRGVGAGADRSSATSVRQPTVLGMTDTFDRGPGLVELMPDACLEGHRWGPNRVLVLSPGCSCPHAR